jgi:nucleotide-binding universal stress UspA family protein
MAPFQVRALLGGHVEVCMSAAPFLHGDPCVVIVGVDGSPASMGALAVACAFAAVKPGGIVHAVLCVRLDAAMLFTDGPIDLADEGRRLEELCRRVGDRAQVPIRRHVAVDRPDHAILTMASEFRSDLVVIGTRRRTGFERALLGSLTDRIVHFAPCPVLVVPDGGTWAHTGAEAQMRHDA